MLPGLCQHAARERVVVEAAKLDGYGVCYFIVKNCEGHLVRVGIGGRSVRVNNLSTPENPQRYIHVCVWFSMNRCACTCMYLYTCMQGVYVCAHAHVCIHVCMCVYCMYSVCVHMHVWHAYIYCVHMFIKPIHSQKAICALWRQAPS